MEEEKILREIVGTENPFTLPPHYFDRFHERMMGQLPVAQKKKKKRIYMRWAVAAAMIGLVCTSSFLLVQHHTHRLSPATETSYTWSEEELEYSLISNQEITEYLTEAE